MAKNIVSPSFLVDTKKWNINRTNLRRGCATDKLPDRHYRVWRWKIIPIQVKRTSFYPDCKSKYNKFLKNNLLNTIDCMFSSSVMIYIFFHVWSSLFNVLDQKQNLGLLFSLFLKQEKDFISPKRKVQKDYIWALLAIISAFLLVFLQQYFKINFLK